MHELELAGEWESGLGGKDVISDLLRKLEIVSMGKNQTHKVGIPLFEVVQISLPVQVFLLKCGGCGHPLLASKWLGSKLFHPLHGSDVNVIEENTESVESPARYVCTEESVLETRRTSDRQHRCTDARGARIPQKVASFAFFACTTYHIHAFFSEHVPIGRGRCGVPRVELLDELVASLRGLELLDLVDLSTPTSFAFDYNCCEVDVD